MFLFIVFFFTTVSFKCFFLCRQLDVAGLKEAGPVVEKEAVLRLTTFLIDKVGLLFLLKGSVLKFMTDLFRAAKNSFCSTVSSQGEDPTSYKFTIDADETNQKVILTTKTNSFVTSFSFNF